jgi:nucleoside-diphosphate-sugar epimerase
MFNRRRSSFLYGVEDYIDSLRSSPSSMTTDKIIAVVGATGQQGGAVARTFAKLPGWTVRGLTRNVNSDAAKALTKSGVHPIAADLDDVESLKQAFTGASAVFGVTDFWGFKDRPSTAALIAEKGITWPEAFYLQEVQQGKNIFDAAAAQFAKEGAGLERLVLSTMSNVKRSSGGKYDSVWHFDSKARFVQYLSEKAKEEEDGRADSALGYDSTYSQLMGRTSYVQMGYYLDNHKLNPLATPRKVSMSQ